MGCKPIYDEMVAIIVSSESLIRRSTLSLLELWHSYYSGIVAMEKQRLGICRHRCAVHAIQDDEFDMGRAPNNCQGNESSFVCRESAHYGCRDVCRASRDGGEYIQNIPTVELLVSFLISSMWFLISCTLKLTDSLAGLNFLTAGAQYALVSTENETRSAVITGRKTMTQPRP